MGKALVLAADAVDAHRLARGRAGVARGGRTAVIPAPGVGLGRLRAGGERERNEGKEATHGEAFVGLAHLAPVAHVSKPAMVRPVKTAPLLLLLLAAKPYRILVVNDDGVHAPGILALAQALKDVGEVTVIAPAENQSSKGHSLTVHEPIYVDAVELPGGIKATAVSATPASCVKVALMTLMTPKPDLVVSGINRGYNLGTSSYESGTVSAAREATLEGVPAIASSMDEKGHPDYEIAAKVTAQLAALVKEHGLPRGVFLDINVPVGPVKGFKVTTQSLQSGIESFVEQKTPEGRRFFWTVYEDPKVDTETTDVGAIAKGFVTVTPLKVGESEAKQLEPLKAWLKAP
jgi:5'-nucleotidase